MASLTEPQIPRITPEFTTIHDHEPVPTPPLPLRFNYSNRVLLRTLLQRNGTGLGLVGQKFMIGGWVKSCKEIKSQPSASSDHTAGDSSPAKRDATFVEILPARVPLLRSIAKIFCSSRARLDSTATKNRLLTNSRPSLPSSVNILVSDGSCAASLQVRIEFSDSLPFQPMPTGTSIVAEGVLNLLQGESKQSLEFQVEKLVHVGQVEENYPLLKKRVPLECLRDCPHFRPRTTTFASVMRIRSSLSFGTHTFFQNHEFVGTHMPILTSTDSLGFSGEVRVSSMVENRVRVDAEGAKIEGVKAGMKEKTSLMGLFKRTASNKEEQDLPKATHLEAKSQTCLTVSNMLHLESFGCSLGNVYCFSPRFLADGNVLAEKWVVEAHMAFSQLEDAMTCAEDYFRFLCRWLLKNCEEDLRFAAKRIDGNRINLLQAMSLSSYERISYSKAVEILEKATNKRFEAQPKLGIPLTHQHLSYMADEVYKAPLMIYDFPNNLKPFYVRLNADAKTVAAFDFIVPMVGILITRLSN